MNPKLSGFLKDKTKVRKLFIILVVLIVAAGCSNQKTIESNPTIKKVFNESEIKDLQLILEFFEKQICSIENKEDSKINDCYDSFIQRMTGAVETGGLEINIPFGEQKKLYNTINDSTFNEIWDMSWIRTIPHSNSYLKRIGKDTLSIEEREKSDTTNYIELKYEGKYVSFIEEYGNKSPVIKRYHENFVNAGGIGPSMISSIMMNYEYYDIKDIRMKLIFAIHYLTLNDQHIRKEKYKK
jgi:CRISPR/Cas system CMR-associated protein Cmr5 small subunit